MGLVLLGGKAEAGGFENREGTESRVVDQGMRFDRDISGLVKGG
jgi:hypothetical protein